LKNDRLEELIHAFCRLSGAELSIQNASFRSVTRHTCVPGKFCTLIHRAPICLEMCRASDKERFALARESEGTLVYRCPFGVTKLHVPISRGKERLGYIFCPIGIVDGDDAETVHRISALAPTLSPNEMRTALSAMPHLSHADFEAYHSILSLIADEIARSNLFEEAPPSIAWQTKEYVRGHLFSKIALADIALHLHCSTVTVTEHFKREYGITVMEYAENLRMEHAEYLLLESDCSVKEIAFFSGFADVEYFSRCFKKRHGMPPGTWRRENAPVLPRKNPEA
jgi:AraC-like DNA-binding protein